MDANLDAAHVLQMRRDAYAKPAVDRGDLTNLLASGRAAGAGAPAEYADLLSQVAVDLLVNQVDPEKYIRAEDADWLVSQLHDGGLSCAAEYEMLVDVIREAVSVPPSLAAFAVGEIEKAITVGHTAASGACDHPAGVVSHDDVEALRVAVFAATQGSSLHVARDSAEALFRVARATAGAANDPSFDAFFAGAVGNYLTGIAHHWTPSVADELEEEKELKEKPSMGGFLGGLFHRAPADARGSVEDAVDRMFAKEDAADEEEMAKADVVDPDETAWLLGQLTLGGALTSAETALIQFLKKQAPSLSANLLAAAGAPAQPSAAPAAA